jgi:hypothetical protein
VDDTRALRAQVRQVAGSLMLHTWQFGTAELAFAMAMDDAPDLLAAMAVVEERCWGLIRQGKLAQTRDLAFGWASENEPRMSAKQSAQARAVRRFPSATGAFGILGWWITSR